MLNQTIRNKISTLWDMFWAAGFSNPLTALEQISYLLFLRRAEDVGLADGQYKWSSYTKESEIDLCSIMANAFDHLKEQHNNHDTFINALKDARFQITKPTLLQAAVDVVNEIYAEAESERSRGQFFQDTLGDFYELILNQTGEAGKNGQFRTPRHIIHFMCELLKPTINDRICDVTCGTSGFLVGAYQYIITHNSTEQAIKDVDGFDKRNSGDKIKPKSQKASKLINDTFFGYDIDPTMIRLGIMNLMMHNIKAPQIKLIDSLSQNFEDKEKGVSYSKIFANPPFTGRIDSLDTSLSLNRIYPPKYDKQGNRLTQNIQSELLFIERIIQLLDINGMAAVIVPEGVLFSGSIAHKKTRQLLLNDCILEAVISLPSGVFKPYTGVKTSILIFKKIGIELKDNATKQVWFYELSTDGYSLDDNRRKLNESPLPNAVVSFDNRKKDNKLKERTSHFFVPFEEIEKNDYDLSLNRYKKYEPIRREYAAPQEILKSLMSLEKTIFDDLQELKGLIG